MQPTYLALLSKPLQAFVGEVEEKAGVTIEVSPVATLNTGGPTGQGKLEVRIETQGAWLKAPTNGYFPNGAVRHEVLHVRRILVEHVPRLALAEDVEWDPSLEKELTQVDNALEHLVIVPMELQCHPDRRAHWELVMTRIWKDELPHKFSELDRRIGVCLHWTFLRHVLNHSPTLNSAIAFMDVHDLRAEADSFSDQLVSRLADKLSMVQLFFDWFSELPRARASVEYVSSVTGSRLLPIPG